MRRFRFISTALLVAMMFCVLPVLLFAQTTGSIAGTITDSTGALVPNAAVAVTNMASNDTRKTVSTGQGVFTVSGLVDGDYSVRIEAKSFKAWEVSGIHVLPGERKSISGIVLQIGADSEVVIVESSSAQLQVTDSGDRVSVLDSAQVTSLGLEGRDVTELVRTLPGFANTGGGLSNTTYDATRTGIVGGSATTSFSGQGLQNSPTSGSGGSDLISDGARVVDPGCNCSSTQTINADMVAEVKVTTSAFSAESSHGPVVVQAVGKSGSASYHGSAYFHYRNAKLNANDYYDKQISQSRFPARYAYPGGNFGGPVLLPRSNFNHDKKLLFWVGYEYYNQKIPDTYSGGTVKANLPTLSERQGLLDPTLSDNTINCGVLQQAASTEANAYMRCQAINYLMVEQNGAATVASLNNSDVSAYLGSGAKSYLSVIPKPNTTPTVAEPYNYITQVQSYDNGFMAHVRVDYAISDSTKLYVTYNRQNDDQSLPYAQYFTYSNAVTFPAGMKYENRSNTLAGNLVKIINPQLINEVSATLARVNVPLVYTTGQNVSKSDLNFPYTSVGASSKYLPYLINYGGGDYGFPSFGQADLNNYQSLKTTPSASDTLTVLFGKHTVKLGYSWQDVDNKQTNTMWEGANGNTYIWGGYYPNPFYNNYAPVDGNLHPLANFLTDNVSSFGSMSNVVLNSGYDTMGGFLQDDWKVTKKLTFNLGLRIDHYGAWSDRASGGNGVAVFSSAYYMADGGTAPTVSTAPGLRTHSMDRDVPKSGRSLPSLFTAPRFGMAYDVFGTGKTVLRGGIGAYYYQDNWNTYSSALAQGNLPDTCSLSTGGYETSWGTYYSSLSTLNAGKGLSCSTSSSFSAYSMSPTASDAEDQKMPYTWTYNFSVSQRTFKDSALEIAYSGNQSLDLAESLNVNVVPLGAYFNQSTYSIYNIVNGTSKIQDSFRPMSNYGAVTLVSHPGWANYNALQVSWNRYHGDLTYGLNYTWSKSMGIANTADPINLHNDYGPLAQNRTHVFNATYSYNVGKRFKSNAILKAALNQWIVTGITTLQSGAGMQANGSINFGLTGTNDTLATTGVYESVNASYYLGSPDYTLMPKLTCSTPHSGMTHSNQYMNANCFAIPDKKVYAQRYWMPYTPGAMFMSNDLTLARNISLKDNQAVEVKASGFNWMNHAMPGFDTSATSNMILNVDQGALVTSVANPNGGTVPVGTTTTKYGHRIIELSLKYSF